ncbi:MAG: hypothetical protein K0S86_1854 [Geminicoccaceae bacterium]|nr:hypothetical protein [Geminicoccaceae bacterium]
MGPRIPRAGVRSGPGGLNAGVRSRAFRQARGTESDQRREPHGGRGSGGRLEMVARLGEPLERGRSNGGMYGNDVGEREVSLRDRRHGRGATARPGARAGVRGTVRVVGRVVGARGMLARARVVGGPGSAIRVAPRDRSACCCVRSTVARAAHQPLGLAHEKRHPERQCDVKSPTPQRTVHAASCGGPT